MVFIAGRRRSPCGIEVTLLEILAGNVPKWAIAVMLVCDRGTTLPAASLAGRPARTYFPLSRSISMTFQNAVCFKIGQKGINHGKIDGFHINIGPQHRVA
jgi:hypothetical protein